MFESKDFNQHLMVSNSILKFCFINWLVNNRFFTNFETYNTSPINLEIQFGKLKTLMFFPHTSNVLLSPRCILWFKVNFSKVENSSFWKVKCYETLESTNHASLQTKEIDKTFIRVQFNLLWLLVKNLCICFFNLVFSYNIILQNGL